MGADRSAQVEVMAHEARLQLFGLILESHDGVASLPELAGPGMDHSVIQHHLETMESAGLLERRGLPGGGQGYTATADSLARFAHLVTSRREATESGIDTAHRRVVHRIAERLAEDFHGVFSRETVDLYVAESYQLLAERAAVRSHLPALTEQFALDRLTALAGAEGLRQRAQVEILFVCVHNSGRSQIAAALARQLGGSVVRVRTAGSTPAAQINPRVSAALDRRSLPLLREFPKPLTDEIVRVSDIIVTMGCGDACPIVPGRRYLDWDVPDPAGLTDPEIDDVITLLEARVRDLLDEFVRSR
ncbi:three-helix bundle dimerization domain-containing protein [Brachybacterium paraconglomeratum]|uniref:arsenate reductase/protein-tyrosine-phosphatase family protein n=2 Tax=Brachybacterium paraconglomeratum TaxID=173362 RepID=UPI0024930DB3|nr:hypothetical protein [Brachybacterium paraconglomeratum]